MLIKLGHDPVSACSDTHLKSWAVKGHVQRVSIVQLCSTQHFLQPVLGLVHEACLGGVDVSTLDLLLSALAEKNLNINSKNEVSPMV